LSIFASAGPGFAQEQGEAIDPDYGDAPQDLVVFNYPVTLATTNPNGPGGHAATEKYYLGGCVDTEQDGQATPDARGDDLNLLGPSPNLMGSCSNNDTDDEDGVFFRDPDGNPTRLTQCDTTLFQVLHTNTSLIGAGYLWAYVDFNRDGDWDDAGEEIFGDGASAQNPPQLLNTGLNDLSFTVPCWSVPTDTLVQEDVTYARFRLFTDNAGLPDDGSGMAGMGEVEDYAVEMYPATEPYLDWGDAPDAPVIPGYFYQTLSANLGASHIVTEAGPVLGEIVDVEWDGQPDLLAYGDDSTATMAEDPDEDGISDFMLFDLDAPSNCVWVRSNTGGFVDAWVDWDLSRTFDKEEYWSGGGGPSFVHPGGTASMCFTLPGDTRAGWTYGRLRISSTGGLDAYGLASDGEVEDWVAVVFRDVTFDLTVYLEGPYRGSGRMWTTLNDSLPLTQPYAAGPWWYPGTESVVSMPSNVVDWLLLELRFVPHEPAPVEAVLLLDDGTVVTTAGTPPVYGLSDSVYVVLSHRNHLDVMSADKQDVAMGSVTYDFTVPGAAYGTDPMKDLGGGPGPFGMYAGDGEVDGVIDDADLNICMAETTSAAAGYTPGNYNMDASTQALDLNLYYANELTGATSHVP
jgi:hypothetical protein